MPTHGPITSCQICESKDLQSVLFLSYLPPVNTMRPLEKAHDGEEWFPAEVLRCPKCHLVQLGYAADPNVLFPPDYPYTSGTTKILRDNFADLYSEVKEIVRLQPDDLIVDIGSNDGTLLKNFLDGGHRVLGVEPSLTSELAKQKGVDTMMTFFDSAAAERVLRERGRAKVITATNVFAHIHGVHALMDNIVKLLTEDGVFISESHYLLDLLKTVQYDTIYHEHLRYYSLTSLQYLLEQHGLDIFHVKKIPTHGGSIRVYASKAKRPVNDSVEKLLNEEKDVGLLGDGWVKPFRQSVLDSKLKLYELLSKIKFEGKRIVAIGAPSRASTLMNYVGLDDGIIESVLEIAGSKKIGKFMPGRHIPVLEESILYRDPQPEYALLLSWHITDELTVNLKKRGYRGDFIVPLPVPRIIRNADI